MPTKSAVTGDNMEKKKICQACLLELSEADDVVVCPECGAPHHRECYASLGKCARSEDHGTENQYDPHNEPKKESEEQEAAADLPKRIRCGNCGTEIIDPNPKFCPHCGKHFSRIIKISGENENGEEDSFPEMNTPFGKLFVDAMGGVDPKTPIENITAGEAASFVAVGTNRYIPKFCELNKNKKTSWNWAAFLIPSAWCFYRKMYKDGIIYLVLHLIGSLCFLPILSFIYAALGGADPSSMTYAELMQIIMANMDSFNAIAAAIYLAGLAIFAVKHIYAGMMSDWHYRNHVIAKVNEIKNDTETQMEEKQYLFLKKGSVNLFLCSFGILVENYMLSILVSLLL